MNIVINPAYHHLTDFVNNLPSIFPKEGETIYEGRNMIKVMKAGDRKIVVKSFKIPHFINKIAYTFLRPSKAERSYKYSLEILSRGCNTPNPVAYIEQFKSGLLDNSYYISEYSEGISMKKEFCFLYPNSPERTGILKEYAIFTAHLHDAGIYHPDYSNGNILYRKTENGNYYFELVDINRVRFGEVTEEMSYHSFHRMALSLEMLEIVAKEYAVQRKFDIRKSIEKITAYNLKTMKPYETFNLR